MQLVTSTQQDAETVTLLGQQQWSETNQCSSLPQQPSGVTHWQQSRQPRPVVSLFSAHPAQPAGCSAHPLPSATAKLGCHCIVTKLMSVMLFGHLSGLLAQPSSFPAHRQRSGTAQLARHYNTTQADDGHDIAHVSPFWTAAA